ncbi:hypothetical protein L0Y46_03070, partial [bacterium]|nr:hypothetical protein [bacterium]
MIAKLHTFLCEKFFKNNAEVMLARIAAVAMPVSVMGGAWDVWWHVMVGRDTFFEPPHLMLYGGIVGSIMVAVYGYIVFKHAVWRRLALLLVGIPVIVAPFDEVWHGIFGVEDLTSVWIVWSPPHVALVLAVMFGWILLLPLLKRDTPEGKRFFGAVAFAGILFLLNFLSIPLQPTGAFHILGEWGAGFRIAGIIAVFLIANRFIGGIGAATQTAIFFIVLHAIGIEAGERSPDIIQLPHADILSWIEVFAYLAA